VSLSVRKLGIDGVLAISTTVARDERGWFMETYRASALRELGIEAHFVQDNHAFSLLPGTIRGLHFQKPPHAQAKLIRVLRGAIFDVAVDVRRGSPSLGKWVGITLSAAGGEQVFVPRGFAHGYCTLEANTEVVYKCDEYYAPGFEAGLNWADPATGIVWPLPSGAPIVSRKDRELPTLAELGAGAF
jgi:dTDP-4-dehydrorhamnose 3,5-epimerase